MLASRLLWKAAQPTLSAHLQILLRVETVCPETDRRSPLGVPVLPLGSHVTLSKCSNPSVSHLPHLYKELLVTPWFSCYFIFVFALVPAGKQLIYKWTRLNLTAVLCNPSFLTYKESFKAVIPKPGQTSCGKILGNANSWTSSLKIFAPQPTSPLNVVFNQCSPDQTVYLYSLGLFSPLSNFFLFCFGSFPGGSDDKESACNVGDWGPILRSERFSWKRKRQPTPIFLSEKFHGHSSLAGYSPWNRKELDTTEQLTSPHSQFNNVVIISDEQWRDSAIHIHVSILP